LFKICITPLFVVCSLHLPKIINCYQQKRKLASLWMAHLYVVWYLSDTGKRQNNSAFENLRKYSLVVIESRLWDAKDKTWCISIVNVSVSSKCM